MRFKVQNYPLQSIKHFVLNVFYSGIEYTEKDWMRFKVRHYPLKSIERVTPYWELLSARGDVSLSRGLNHSDAKYKSCRRLHIWTIVYKIQ